MKAAVKTVEFDIDENEFIEAYRPYIDPPQAIQLIIGNTGSAKSGFFYRKAIAFALGKKYFRFVFTRKVKDTIRDSIFLGLTDVISEWNLKDYFQIREHEMDIICRANGNRLLSFGLDDPKKLKSIKDPSHWFWDEFDESDFKDFAEIRRRLRTQKVKQTQFWGALNPVAGWWGKEYFFPEEFHEAMPLGEIPALTENTLILKTSYRQNPHVNHQEMEQKNRELALLDENNWIVYEEGNWGKLTTGGEFYNQFKRRIHSAKVEFIPGLPVHLTFDFNVLPYMTMLASQVRKFQATYDPKKRQIVSEIANTVTIVPNNGTELLKIVTVFQVRIFREYCLADPHNTTEHCCQYFLEGYGNYKSDVFYYGDAMGNKRQEGSGNKTEYKKVRELLARFVDDASDRTWRANPSVLQRRNFMNKILAQLEIVPGLVIQIVIDSSAKETIKDFENVKLGPDGKLKQIFHNKTTGQKYQLYGHPTDATDYLMTKLFEHYYKALKV
jgi:phage terminase large subunit